MLYLPLSLLQPGGSQCGHPAQGGSSAGQPETSARVRRPCSWPLSLSRYQRGSLPWLPVGVCALLALSLSKWFNFFHTSFNILLFLVDEKRKACSEKYITAASTAEMHPGAACTACAANFKNKWSWYLQKPDFAICSLRSGGYIFNKALVVINC